MATTRTAIRMALFSVLSVLIQMNCSSFSQTTSYPIKEWAKKMSDRNGPAASGIDDMLTALKGIDTTQGKEILNSIEKEGSLKNNYFKARFLAAKAKWTWQNLQNQFRSYEGIVTQTWRQALNAAYETNNDSLISEISWMYGEECYFFDRTEPAAMYLLFAAELDEKSGRKSKSYNCWLLGNILYKTRDYRKAMYYTLASIQRETDTSRTGERMNLSRYNTVGLCYQKISNYDSAFFYYDKAMKIADKLDDTLWKGIISGNKGQIYYLQKKYSVAKPLLFFDYSVSKDANEQPSAANSLQWVARISLAQGKKDSALAQVREALRLLRESNHYYSAYYCQNVYYAAAEVYRAFGNSDSASGYSELYINVHDSIERGVADSRLEISKIKLDNLQNVLAIKNLQKDKEATALRRNFILLVIVLVAVIAIFMLYRQRQKLAYRQQMAKAEVVAARDQMFLFRQNIIEKTRLIEKLEAQVQDKKAGAERLEILAELSQHTILTEEDWDKFKWLFEKIHPGFFVRLKVKAHDITVAEQRMAALTRLHLTRKQIASMLGISVESVLKSRQRLRQRLNFPPEANLEQFIGNF